MTGRWLKLVILANLLVALALVFIYPHLMVSPGALARGHQQLATDCFACHAPLRGATAERCVACHKVAGIGLQTTQGLPIAKPTVKTSFHQELTEHDCMACHSDHAGPRLSQRSRKPFSHELLKPATRQRCDTCHAAPKNKLHQALKLPCAQCHKTQGWKPASFDHAALAPPELSRCDSCHQPPSDSLHRQVKGSCAQCHRAQAWKPASFAHDKLFVLDRDHDTACVTCHQADDYRRYTCYGCHEHTPANVLAEHREEGVTDLANCVRCHRSADENEGRGGGEGRERD